jgi:uncharacterized protein (DUF1684 family)
VDDDFAAAYVELADYRRRVHEMYAAARGGTALVLDSNYGHHPSCVYSPRWSCPLAPPGNRIDAAVTAGERCSAP